MSRMIVLMTLVTTTSLVGAEEQPLTVIDNSIGISQVVDINRHGQVVGKKEIPVPALGLGQIPYFYDGDGEAPIEALDGYTNIEPEALSDRGQVVGFVSRALGHPEGSLRAFVWNSATRRIAGLEMLEGHRGSHALDISADGSRIVGYSTGAGPPQMVPCLWEHSEDGSWRCRQLSTIHAYNPVLLASRVVVSDNGELIAACITAKVVEGEIPIYQNALFRWQRQEGEWERQHLRDGSFCLYGINNHGMLAGSVVVDGKRRAFVFDPEDGFQIIELLEGDESGQALALNNEGTVVGYSDDPYGPIGGPRAFIWSHGKMSPLQFPVATLYSSAQAINDQGQIGGYYETEPAAEDGQSDMVSFLLSP